MAHLHFRRTVYKSGGSAATHRLEYITRQSAHELTAAERQLRYTTGEREDLVYARSRNLPAWCHDNPHVYFQAAERYERAGGVAFEEWKISLPVDLDHRANMALTRDLVEAIAGDRLPITYAFHDPTTMDGRQHQPHLHLLLSARRNDAHVRTAAQHFTRYNAAHPARGGAQKDPAINHMGAVKAHRIMIADLLNIHLERAGHTGRVHPERLLERGIDRRPEPKLLPSESRQYREHGIVSARMQQVLQVRAERTRQLPMEEQNARVYWDGCKATLGITPEMPHEQRLARISAARAQVITRGPHRATGLELARDVTRLERSLRHLDHALHQGQGPRGRDPQPTLAQRVERLGAALARQRGQAQAPQAGSALNIRLPQREREPERGMGW